MAKIRLVLADKEEIFPEGLAKLLESEPDIEVVCTCHTGLEAIECVYKHQPDVILMDIGLPKCSGVEVVHRIHEGLSKTNIIVLTHTETDANLISAIRAGAKAYLSKDVSIKSLIKAIILVAEGGGRCIPSDGNKTTSRIQFLRGGQGCDEVDHPPEQARTGSAILGRARLYQQGDCYHLGHL